MTARVPENTPFLYLAEVDLYRIGSSESPKLDKARAVDIDTYDRNGIQFVTAYKKGISLFTEADLLRTRFAGWVWKIPQGTGMPSGLGLVNDLRPAISWCAPSQTSHWIGIQNQL